MYLIAKLNSVTIALTINTSKFSAYSKRDASDVPRRNILKKFVLRTPLGVAFAKQTSITLK